MEIEDDVEQTHLNRDHHEKKKGSKERNFI